MTAEDLAAAMGAKRCGAGWVACCPAHDDHTPSLGIDAGDDGRALVRCRAGCEQALVIAALRERGLWSPEARATRPARPPQTARERKRYATLNQAADAARWGAGKTLGADARETRRDVYHAADGREVAAVLRFDNPAATRKTYRPLTRDGDGWRLGDPAGLWPLFRLPELLASDAPIVLSEGEKAAAAGASIGLLCTTTAHGAQSPHRSDFKPVAGRAVIILPDNDRAGKAYAATVAGLCRAAGARSVKIVELPGQPPKGDIADLPATAETRELVKRLAAEAPEWQPAPDAVSAIADKAAPPTAGPGKPDFEDIRAQLWELAQAKLSATEFYRRAAAAVVGWLHGRGSFYYDATRPAFDGVLYFDNERKLLLPVQSDALLAWLADCLAVNRSERVFQFVASAIETEGLSERSTAIHPAAFFAARPGACYISCGPGRMARLSAGRVELVDNGADGVLFPVGACLEPWALVEPRDPFESCALFRDMAAAAPHGPMLFRLWATALPADGKTKPPLCATAPVGGGKTALVRGLFALMGIPETVNAVSKGGEGDFWAAVDAGGLVCFDNCDSRVDWLADALAAAATAGTFTKRRLYTDRDRVTLRARAAIALTSANPTFAADAGLADRLIVVRLNRRTGETAEGALFDEIRANRDAGLSWIANTLAGALDDVAPVPSGLNARHPDFAALAVRIGRAMGREAEAVNAMRAAEADKHLFNLENDVVGAALLELVTGGPFEGTAGELLEALKVIDPAFEGRLSDKRLGKRLSKLWPHLENTLGARKERDSNTKNWRYSFRPAPVFPVFGEAFSEKSYARENIGSFVKTPLETPQTPQTPDPTLFDNAEEGEI